MEVTEFRTAKGPVSLWGGLGQFSTERPLLLVIRGAFPIPEHLTSMPDRLPTADVALAHLPGMHTPMFADCSISGFASGFDELIEQAFPGRPVTVLGASMGGLAALSLRHPAVRRILALDPPLSTAGLWPMRNWLRDKVNESAEARRWIWEIFGLDEHRVENRDYAPVLAGLDAPARVLLGSSPLDPERPFELMPSLVGEADRRLYRGHPNVEIEVVPDTGHNIPRDGLVTMMARLREALGVQP